MLYKETKTILDINYTVHSMYDRPVASISRYILKTFLGFQVGHKLHLRSGGSILFPPPSVQLRPSTPLMY